MPAWLLLIIGCLIGLALVGTALWLAVIAERRRSDCLPSQMEQHDNSPGYWAGDSGGSGFHSGGDGGGHH